MKKISLILAAIVIIALLVLSGAIPFGLEFGTGLTADTSADFPVYKRAYEKEKGEEWCKGQGHEIVQYDMYVSSWQPGEYSQQITTRADFQFDPCYGSDEANQGPFILYPGQYLGRYYMNIVYVTTSGSTTIYKGKENWWDTNVIEMINPPPSNDWVSGEGWYFPNTKTQYKTYSIMEDQCKDKTWWLGGAADTCNIQYGQSCKDKWQQISTHTHTFRFKGPKVGKITINYYLETAVVESDEYFPGFWNDIWHIHDFHIAQDEAYIASGEGEINIESVNSIGDDGEETTPETGITYTKYVYEEGSQVTISVDALFSGKSLEPGQTGVGKGWSLRVYGPDGTLKQDWDVPDDVQGKKYYYTIPEGSFNPGGNNEWKVVLMNTLFSQSETRLFVVDSYDKIPGKTTVTTDKNTYNQYETVYVTLEAQANPTGTNEIHHFRAWATYDSPNGNVYAYNPSDIPASNQGGNTYGAQFNFQVSKGEKDVYIRAHAIDKDGRAGPENDLKSIHVKQETGSYKITISVTSDGTPLQGAKVKMDDKESTTNSFGVAYLYMEPGIYDLKVSKSEYNTYNSYNIQVNSDLFLNVVLTKSSIPGTGDLDVAKIYVTILIAAVFAAIAFFFRKRIPFGVIGQVVVILVGVISGVAYYFLI